MLNHFTEYINWNWQWVWFGIKVFIKMCLPIFLSFWIPLCCTHHYDTWCHKHIKLTKKSFNMKIWHFHISTHPFSLISTWHLNPHFQECTRHTSHIRVRKSWICTYNIQTFRLIQLCYLQSCRNLRAQEACSRNIWYSQENTGQCY